MKSFFRNYFLLFLIFLLALFLRVYLLGSVPYGLHEDEIMNGYVGRFILLNGKDLYSHVWPLFYFDNFGDYPNVIPMYFSGAATFIFGVNAFAVRLPIAVAGALSVIPVYLISRQIFKKKIYALCSALFLAILPWHIILSRSTAENVTATFVYLWAIYFLLLFLKNKKKLFLVIFSLLGGCTYFLYPSYRIIIPLTILSTFLLFLRQRKKIFLLPLLALGFLLITLLISRTPWGQGRFKQTSIFSFNNTVINRLNHFAFVEGSGHVLTARIFYNKPMGYGIEFIRQYLSYFSTIFLFEEGGKPDRYRLINIGMYYTSFLIIVICGISSKIFSKIPRKALDVFTKDGKWYFGLILILLALSLVPAALTLDDVPNIHRALPMGVLGVFFVTYCLSQFETIFKFRKYFYVFVALSLLLETIFFWHQWIADSPVDQEVYRENGRTALVEYLISHQNSYDAIYLSKNVKVLYYLFYKNNFDSSLAGKFSFNIMMSSIDNLHFINADCVESQDNLELTKNSLIVDRPECVKDTKYNLGIISTINRVDFTPAFNLLTPTSTPIKKP